jgi:pSer/pThr/pTyr-binding forkhead associated (FHA) protein
VAEGQPILPDVDLSPYDAYAQGVSRLHAALKVTRNRVAIMDLGSSNGTRVNGQKIVPHVDYPLNHSDVIALGKLKLQVIIK